MNVIIKKDKKFNLKNHEKPNLKKIKESKITKIIAIIFTIILATLIIWKIINKKTTETNIDLSFVQEVENITPPTFSDNICNIIDYGANNNLKSFFIGEI